MFSIVYIPGVGAAGAVSTQGAAGAVSIAGADQGSRKVSLFDAINHQLGSQAPLDGSMQGRPDSNTTPSMHTWTTTATDYEHHKGDFILDVQNITNAASQKSGLRVRNAHCTVFQEHTLDAEGRATFNLFCQESKLQAPKCGPLDPEHTKPSAGVGFSIAKPFSGIDIPPVTPGFTAAINTGRFGHHAIEIGSSTTVSIGNQYGWTGGHEDTAVARRTNLLIKAYIEELEHHPPGPKLLVGDLNCEGAEDLTHLQTLIDEQGWVDIGKHADKYGQPASQPTCRAPNSTVKTRRDYIYANPEALAIIKHFSAMMKPFLSMQR